MSKLNFYLHGFMFNSQYPETARAVISLAEEPNKLTTLYFHKRKNERDKQKYVKRLLKYAKDKCKYSNPKSISLSLTYNKTLYSADVVFDSKKKSRRKRNARKSRSASRP